MRSLSGGPGDVERRGGGGQEGREGKMRWEKQGE
jgi:hypothetical protein